jgi:hypothetical protein
MKRHERQHHVLSGNRADDRGGCCAGISDHRVDQSEKGEAKMNILVACEESQRVCTAFREKGHNAFSCDILPCSGGHPEWHIMQDVLPLLDGDCEFKTMDGQTHTIEGKWDMIIAFPPCTYLTVTGNRWFNVDRYGEKAIRRHKGREEAVKFFMAFVNADCPRIAIENPIGYMSSAYRKPNQIIHPYMFGDPARKATCLWLKGLKPLDPTNIVEPVIIKYKNGKGTDNPWHMDTMSLPPDERAKARSKTFHGIALAMQKQWGKGD